MNPTSISRTSSMASVSSSDDVGSANDTRNVSRRTRKRFSSSQLTILENVFHRNSHPSRKERDTLAMLGGMETKSVTIWFQNKRQTERKVALNNANHSGRSHSQPSSSPVTSRSSSSRPSLDSVASRSELRIAHTPIRRCDPKSSIWEKMPSSPIASTCSPPLHEYVEFGKSKRTLEWACAAARLSDKNSGRSSRRLQEPKQMEKLDSTDDDTDEAVTPSDTLGGEDIRWATKPDGRMVAYPEDIQDDDVIKAALTLCGLGRYPLSRQG